MIRIFQADIGEEIKTAYSNDYGGNVVRQEMFAYNCIFTGSFECEENVSHTP